jgi:hypothetical protein
MMNSGRRRALPTEVVFMKLSYIGFTLGALLTVGAVLSLPSCGHQQKLVGLSIQPSTFTFLTQAGSEQYTATATYIHPPATKDVTSQATWKVDDDVVHITAGLASPDPLLGCGGGTISATMPEGTGGAENIVTAYATVTVDNPADPRCPGGGSEATLSVQVVGDGTVTSLTGGIACPPGPCIADFPIGASVGLTANPGPNATVTWTGCTASGNSCTVTVPNGGVNVLATFN